MSNYRDDNQDTAVAGSSTFGGFSSISDGIARISDALLFGIAITLSSQAIAGDEVIDNSIQVLYDSALITDSITDAKRASQAHLDGAKITDSLRYGLTTIQPDSAAISDELLTGSVTALSIDSAQAGDDTTSQRHVASIVKDSAKANDGVTAVIKDTLNDSAGTTDSAVDKLRGVQLVSDQAIASDALIDSTAYLAVDSVKAYDQVYGKRHVATDVFESARASDALIFKRTDVIDDSAGATDSSTGKWQSRGVLTDTAAISDDVVDSIVQNAVISDSAFIADEAAGKLDAKVVILDGAVIEDIVINTGGHQGQAWTANVDSWAMSRYNPYNYNRLVVINGVLYGEADDGIYRLDEQVSAVTASVKTGKMDLGKGALTHPSTAYLEYELSGGASMTVSTTQKGVEQQYTYMLPNEVADELTNGRFIFGRGLRGRHFAFELIMIGTHGHVNDLSIEHTTTSRRV